MKKQGMAIHCHHNILIENCYDYDERVKVIKRDKPQNEQEIRLRLFKLLSQEAIAELPKELIKAGTERNRAYAEWKKADAEWNKAEAEWNEIEIWHKKWCGCAEWSGGEIHFV